jgi:ABC-type sugar transport system substrate-binding protein
MRVRRAHKHAGERAGKLDVGDEAPAPEQETAILDAAQRRADALVVRAVSL